MGRYSGTPLNRMKKNYLAFLSLLVLITSFGCKHKEIPSDTGSDADVLELIDAMTVQEKAGQMTQLNLDMVCIGEIYQLHEPHRIDSAKLRKAVVEYHVGSILNCGGHSYPRSQWLEIIRSIQEVATTETRLKIPVLYGIDAIHGANYVSEATLFPHQLAQAATFNPELTRQTAEITAYETRAAGIPWNFSPVLDVARNPLWSRYFETYGEDPYVCSVFGQACIRGYQGAKTYPVAPDHVAACMKHFLGYSGARTGKDRTPAYIPERELREIYLPSFRAAIEAGALSIMINSGELNGVPVHADHTILTDLLRHELRFEGVAVTDWEDVIKLHANHRVAPNLKEAVYMAVMAGIDMCMVPNDYDFTRYLVELVQEGRIPESRLDVSVERILRLKQRLGILRKAAIPSVQDFPEFGSAEHAALAKSVALEAITLLSNPGDILPLSQEARILVTGPAAHSMTMLNGAWSRTWQGTDSSFDDTTRLTIVEAIRKRAGSTVTYAEGCTTDSLTNISDAERLATSCDVIVACIGEKPSTEKPGDIQDLTLPAAQVELVQRLLGTGKPVVLVLVENRPLIVREIAESCSAVVMAYQPGDFGGEAIADILMGITNPSGKLPFTYPRYVNDLILYDHKQTEAVDPGFGFHAFRPQWPFGHGLSYSDIEYSGISLSHDTLTSADTLDVRVTIRNLSERDTRESVLLFIRDDYASITPPVRKLRDFTKVDIRAGQQREVHFRITRDDLAFIGKAMKPVTEEGHFTIMLGSSSQTFYFNAR